MPSPFRRPPAPLSSSPLPSLDQILSQIKKPEVPSVESPRMFTTAASFVRTESHPIDLTTPVREPSEPIEPADDDVVVVYIPPPGLRKKRKKGGKKLLEWKAPPRAKTPPPPEDDKPWRKYQTTPSPDSNRTKKTRGKARQDDVVRSRHFSVSEGPGEEKPGKKKKEAPPKPSDEPLQLAPAQRRRAEWTPPPPDRVIELNSSAPLPVQPSSAQDPNSTAAAPGQSFESLLESYSLANEEPAAEAVAGPGPVTEMLRKRKLAEAAIKEAETAAAREVSPVKKPAKKRKPRTITELATAAYAMPEPEPQPAPTESMLDYLDVDADAGDKAKPETKKGRKPRPKKAKPAPPPEPILLSPGTAIRQVYAQDFVFGTSSQLILGDLSPVVTQTRRLPPAYPDEDPFASPINSDAVEPEPKKKLWEVGARDEDGRLLDLPVIDLVGELDPDAMGLEINPFGYAGGARGAQNKGDDVSPPETTSPPSGLAEPEVLAPEKTATKASVAGLGKAAYTPPNTIPPSQQPADAAPFVAVTAPCPQEPAGPPRPKYDLFTDAQLAREVAKFGFKSIKRRTAMVALLEQCWESKNGTRAPLSPLPSNRSLSTTAPASAPAKASAAASPKKPRGRPKKTATATAAAAAAAATAAAPVELDSTEPPPSGQPVAASPKRPRGRPRKDASPARTLTEAAPKTPEKRGRPSKAKVKRVAVIEIPDSEAEDTDMCATSPEMPSSSPPDVDVTLSLDDKTEGSLAVGADNDQASLMGCITQAVRAAPATSDPSQPSWHEKMLMYEPVILEDLAAWLNTGPLTRAGYDGEVSPGEVKQWCEAKSVCCLWRRNISGKERKRF